MPQKAGKKRVERKEKDATTEKREDERKERERGERIAQDGRSIGVAYFMAIKFDNSDLLPLANGDLRVECLPTELCDMTIKKISKRIFVRLGGTGTGTGTTFLP